MSFGRNNLFKAGKVVSQRLFSSYSQQSSKGVKISCAQQRLFHSTPPQKIDGLTIPFLGVTAMTAMRALEHGDKHHSDHGKFFFNLLAFGMLFGAIALELDADVKKNNKEHQEKSFSIACENLRLQNEEQHALKEIFKLHEVSLDSAFKDIDITKDSIMSVTTDIVKKAKNKEQILFLQFDVEQKKQLYNNLKIFFPIPTGKRDLYHYIECMQKLHETIQLKNNCLHLENPKLIRKNR